MKVAFDSTIDLKTDAHMLLATEIGSVKKYFWLNMFSMLVVCALFAIIFVQLGGGHIIIIPPAIIISTIVWIFAYKPLLRRNIKKTITKQFGGKLEMPVAYELNDEGIEGKIGEGSSFIGINESWADIKKVNLTETRIEIISNAPTIVILLPSSAFKSVEEFKTCYEYIQIRVDESVLSA